MVQAHMIFDLGTNMLSLKECSSFVVFSACFCWDSAMMLQKRNSADSPASVLRNGYSCGLFSATKFVFCFHCASGTARLTFLDVLAYSWTMGKGHIMHDLETDWLHSSTLLHFICAKILLAWSGRAIQRTLFADNIPSLRPTPMPRPYCLRHT